MANQASGLRYAVRPRVVLKYSGQLCLVLAVLTFLPLAVSLAFADRAAAMRYAVVVGALAIGGGVLARRPVPGNVQVNEGVVLVAVMFLLTPLIMSYPLMAGGMRFPDALFEAISAVTTTGLSARASLAHASPAFLFGRAWMQWYGGLGFVVLSLALVVRPGLVAKGLAATEAYDEDLVGGTRAHARRVLAVYLWLTGIGVVGAWLAGIEPFAAVLDVFSSVSTGGFAGSEGSLAALALPAQVWISLLCLAGAIPLTFYYRVFRQRQFVAVDLLQVLAIIAAALVTTVLLAATMHLVEGLPWAKVLHHAPLLALSAQSTAGFSTLDPARLDADSKLVLIFSMLLGGGIGSTAGGFKVLRLLVALGVLRLFVLRACLPKHAVIEPRLAGRRLEADEIQEALLLILLFAAVVALSWLPFLMMGYHPIDALFEVVSATSTVGLSAGVTSAGLPLLLKGVLCADMLLGRLEILAWLIVLYPGTWFGRRMEAS